MTKKQYRLIAWLLFLILAVTKYFTLNAVIKKETQNSDLFYKSQIFGPYSNLFYIVIVIILILSISALIVNVDFRKNIWTGLLKLFAIGCSLRAILLIEQIIIFIWKNEPIPFLQNNNAIQIDNLRFFSSHPVTNFWIYCMFTIIGWGIWVTVLYSMLMFTKNRICIALIYLLFYLATIYGVLLINLNNLSGYRIAAMIYLPNLLSPGTSTLGTIAHKITLLEISSGAIIFYAMLIIIIGGLQTYIFYRNKA